MLVPQLGSVESKNRVDKPSSACLCDATRTEQLLQPPTVTPAPVDRITAAANQVADATESKDTIQREEAKLCLLSKQVFWGYHMPVLVAQRKPVKSFFFFFLSGSAREHHTCPTLARTMEHLVAALPTLAAQCLIPFRRTALSIYRDEPNRSAYFATDAAGCILLHTHGSTPVKVFYEEATSGPLYATAEQIRSLPYQDRLYWLAHFDASKQLQQDAFSIRCYAGTNKVVKLLTATGHELSSFNDVVHIQRVQHSIDNASNSAAWLPLSYEPNSLHRSIVLLTCAMVDAWRVDKLKKPMAMRRQAVAGLKSLKLLHNTMTVDCKADAQLCERAMAPLALLVRLRDWFSHDLPPGELNIKLALTSLSLLEPSSKDLENSYKLKTTVPDLMQVLRAQKQQGKFQQFLDLTDPTVDVQNTDYFKYKYRKFWELLYSELILKLHDSLTYISSFKCKLLTAVTNAQLAADEAVEAASEALEEANQAASAAESDASAAERAAADIVDSLACQNAANAAKPARRLAVSARKAAGRAKSAHEKAVAEAA